MRRTIKVLTFPVVMLTAGCLVAGCGSTVKSAAGNLRSRTATSTATPTAVPSTVFTTATPPPTVTTAAAPTGSPTAAASGSSTNTGLIWLLVAVGVLVLAGLITWIARSGRRRSAAAAWQSRLVDVYAKGSALHDAMSVAEQGNLADGDARARWYDIQRRADDLAQTLYALREVAPNSVDQTRITDVLASLQATRSAMDAEWAPGGAGPRQADVVRSRLYAFESSLHALRADDADLP
jgi:hypothetical protein